jgi:hypothetical protein
MIKSNYRHTRKTSHWQLRYLNCSYSTILYFLWGVGLDTLQNCYLQSVYKYKVTFTKRVINAALYKTLNETLQNPRLMAISI